MEIFWSSDYISNLILSRTRTKKVNLIQIKTAMITDWCFVSNHTGIHYVGEVKNNTINKLLVDQLTEGQLQWSHLIDPNDVVSALTLLNLLSLDTISLNSFCFSFLYSEK